jgi:hypothetical protein
MIVNANKRNFIQRFPNLTSKPIAAINEILKSPFIIFFESFAKPGIKKKLIIPKIAETIIKLDDTI